MIENNGESIDPTIFAYAELYDFSGGLVSSAGIDFGGNEYVDSGANDYVASPKILLKDY